MEEAIDLEVREILVDASRTPIYGDGPQQTAITQTESPSHNATANKITKETICPN